ncbi:MAG: tetratricopeptide repeat protein [Cyanobacteria bacterium]|nr:tetratricopeptide repeat protein [Cyanobacteriota bacterium]
MRLAASVRIASITTFCLVGLLGTQIAMYAAGPAEAKTHVSPSFKTGVEAYNKGYIQKAIPAFESAFRADAKSLTAGTWLVKALMRQGGPANTKRAELVLRKILMAHPGDPWSAEKLGTMLSWHESSQPEAAKWLKVAVDNSHANNTYSASLEVRILLSEVLSWTGRYSESVKYGSLILAQVPNTRGSWFEAYALSLIKTKHWSEAKALYEGPLRAQLDTNPNVIAAYADTLRNLNALPESVMFFQKARDITLNKITVLKQSTQFDKLLSQLSSLAYDLGVYDTSTYQDGLILSQQLSAAGKQAHANRLRIARTLAKLDRAPEAIDTFQLLYKQGWLNTAEKLEYADYLSSLKLPDTALPDAGIVESLYNEVLHGESTTENTTIHLKLARIAAIPPHQDFDSALQHFHYVLSQLPNAAIDEKALKQEVVDFLKSSTSDAEKTNRAFEQLIHQFPEDSLLRGGYAEYLSWQPAHRVDSLKGYVALVQENPAQFSQWQDAIENVLDWHTPDENLMPLYSQILTLNPKSRGARLSEARLYRDSLKQPTEALSLFEGLVQDYPEDKALNQEWVGLLQSNEIPRKEALKQLAGAVDKFPKNPSILTAYGKLLSYTQHYDQAITQFNRALKLDPDQREAMVGKAHAYLWSGQPLAAKSILVKARSLFPQDPEILMGLAEAEKQNGRYDQAMDILKQLRPLINWAPAKDTQSEYILVDRREILTLATNSVSDVSMDPPDQAQFHKQAFTTGPNTTVTNTDDLDKMVHELDQQIASSKKTPPEKRLATEMTAEYEHLIRDLDNTIQRAQPHLQAPVVHSALVFDQHDRETSDENNLEASLESSLEPASAHAQQLNTVYGPRVPIVYDFPVQESSINAIETSINRTLRPVYQAGFGFLTQQGDPTTVGLRGRGFPNQMSLAITPQVRLRGGITPTRWYLPRARQANPATTWGIEYSWGGTAKLWDRLTLDGDMAITQYTDSSTSSLTYQASAKYQITDHLVVRTGMRRLPLENSLLSLTGIRPNNGVLNGQLLGQARENSFFVDVNSRFTQHIDANFNYEYGWVDGNNIPTNTKQQFFASTGYSVPLDENTTVRMGYEFLYFSYRRNATNGYFDIVNGQRGIFSGLNPAVNAAPGYIVGGYFSPRDFYLNAFRLDLQGNLYKKFIQYRLGGSLGIQSFNLGHGIIDSSPTTLASSFNTDILMNWTDSVSTYITGNFIDSGGLFQRWRFGGGIIYRPNVPGLMPLIK